MEQQVTKLTGGQVVITGLGGRFPDALRLVHAEVHDTEGAWLLLDGVALDWSPLALLHGEARVNALTARRIAVPRLPATQPAPAAKPASSQPFSLPVRVSVQSLRVARAEIGAPVAGVAAVLALDGSAHLASLQDGDADVTIDRLDSAGSYEVHGKIDPTHLAARLAVNEPPHGLIAGIAKLPDIGAIGLQASVDGPRTAEVTNVRLTAGPAHLAATGTVDLTGQSADLDVTANAPAMTPAPGVSWQSIALEGPCSRPLHQAGRHGQLQAAGLAAGGAAVAKLTAELHGNQGAAGLRATAEGGAHPRAQARPDRVRAAGVAGRCTAGRTHPPGHLQPDAPVAAGDGPRRHRRRDHRPCGPDRARPAAARGRRRRRSAGPHPACGRRRHRRHHHDRDGGRDGRDHGRAGTGTRPGRPGRTSGRDGGAGRQ